MTGSSPLIEPVNMIVLTGGPCSGKSSSLAYLTEKLSDHGFMVFVIPETATLITNNGIDRRKMDKAKQVVMFEETIFDIQLAFEENYKKAVTRIFPGKKKVILLDRGIMDIKAFIPQEDFKAILKRKGLSEVNLRDRYNGVIHLVTAADGASEFYTGENNTARLETPEEALLIDQRTRESWLGHPRFKLIDNRTDFKGKIERTFEAIAQILGIPAPLAKKERYLVVNIDYRKLPAHQIIGIEQIYLKSRTPDEEVRIKKRSQDNACMYFVARTRTVRKPDVRIEEEELITEQEYLNLRKLIDPKTEAIHKERICLLWNNQRIEIDRFQGRYEGLAIMEIETVNSNGQEEEIHIPPFIEVGGNITVDRKYSSKHMAYKKRAKNS